MVSLLFSVVDVNEVVHIHVVCCFVLTLYHSPVCRVVVVVLHSPCPVTPFFSASCWRDFHHYTFCSAVLPEGCTNYNVLDDVRRYVNYTATDGLTDEDLQPGWYRFLLNGTNAVIPTFYVRVSRFSLPSLAVHNRNKSCTLL